MGSHLGSITGPRGRSSPPDLKPQDASGLRDITDRMITPITASQAITD